MLWTQFAVIVRILSSLTFDAQKKHIFKYSLIGYRPKLTIVFNFADNQRRQPIFRRILSIKYV